MLQVLPGEKVTHRTGELEFVIPDFEFVKNMVRENTATCTIQTNDKKAICYVKALPHKN